MEEMMMAPALVWTHIAAGGVGLLSGAAAMIARKGHRMHRLAGKVFFPAMLIMASLGAYGALLRPEAISVLNGILSCYLVATSWLIIRRRDGRTGPFDFSLFLVALAVGCAHVFFGLQAAADATGLVHGFPPAPYFIFGAVALIAAALDGRMLLAGGVYGRHRIARHLWRMSFALFIATASLFLGQPQVFPEALQGTLLLAAPVILVIVASLYWLLRVLLSAQYRNA